MSKKSVIEYVDPRLLPIPFYVGVCIDYDDLKKELKRLRVDDEGVPGSLVNDGTVATVRWFCSKGGRNEACIVCIDLGEVRDTADLVDTCAHEARHIEAKFFETINEHCPGEETSALVIGGFAGAIFRAVEKMRAKKEVKDA